MTIKNIFKSIFKNSISKRKIINKMRAPAEAFHYSCAKYAADLLEDEESNKKLSCVTYIESDNGELYSINVEMIKNMNDLGVIYRFNRFSDHKDLFKTSKFYDINSNYNTIATDFEKLTDSILKLINN